MPAPVIRVHRDRTVTADAEVIGRIYPAPEGGWTVYGAGEFVAWRHLRRAAVDALLDHIYGKDRWT
jgi:hypothetical protein